MSTDRTHHPVAAQEFTSLAALLAVVVGGMVLVGWVFDIVVLKSILPGWVAMKANAAVCFILIGVALWLTARPLATFNPQRAVFFSHLARFCVLLAGLIGLLTLCEYMFGWNLGIDQWLFREPAGAVGTSHPGRMAQEAALSLVLLATALWISGGSRKTRWTVLASVSLGLLVATIGLVAMLSHLTPDLGAYGWFGFSIMAMHAAMMLVILGLAVIAISWQPDVLQWSLSRNTTTAFACGIVVLVFIGFNTSRSQFLMKETNRQIAYSEEVMNNTLGLLIEVINTKAQARSYFITGDEQFKTHYLEAQASSNVKLDALRKLVADHPHQQRQFARVEASANAAFQWFKQVVDAKRTGMADAARNQMFIHGEGLLDNFRSTFDQIENEHQQFVEQLKQEAESVSRLSYLIIFIGTLASLLIFLIGIFRLNTAASESKRKEDEYRTVIYTSFDGFCTADFSGRILDVNEAYCQMLGYTREEFLRLHVRDFEASESPEETAAHFQKFIRTGSDRFQTRQRRKDGAILDVEASVQYVAALGERIFSFTRDITERKRTEDLLRASEEFKSSMIDNSSDCIKVLDREGMLKYMSPGGQRLLEIEDINKYLNKSWVDFWNGEDRKAAREAVSKAAQGEIGGFQGYSPSEKGTPKWWDIVITPIRGADGTVNTLLAVSRDITERKKAEEKIYQLNTELEERVHSRTAELEVANKELEAFAYSVSHDLRAPLRAIDGFSRKVVAGYGDKLDDEGRRQLQVVRDNAQSMGKLIDDLLAFSRMGRREMALQPLDMDTMVKGVIDELRAAEPQRTIEFAFSPLPHILGDAAMLRQVWVNLLANAVKFSRQRPVAHIEVGGRAESGEVLYWVKDDGAGFDMQYASKLFGVFQRLHRQDEFEGTGVGLAIAQRILHRHNGRIWGEGKPDAGATFWFALPLPAG